MNDTTAVAPMQSPDLTKAELTLQLSKEGLAYQTLLQECENVKFTRDNLNEERGSLINLRKVKTKLEAMQNPHTKAWADWNSAKKSLIDPVAILLSKKAAEFSVISHEIESENKKIEAEKQRKVGILSEIDNFFINQSQAIAAATEPSELVRIEKLIGSNKANSSRYQEFLPLLNAKAANLTELIKVQKEAIKILDGLKRKEMAAEAIGDDETVLALRENQEQVTQTLEQGRIDVQEKAISMATVADVVELEIIVTDAPKPRRQTWTWDIVDINQTQKKMPSWVILSVDVPKVDEYLRVKKAEGFDGEEFEFAGIKFWLKKDY